jgi:hypothetical protein
MRIKRIHVNQHNIKWNMKNPDKAPKPVMTVKCGGNTYIGNTFQILGESTGVYKPQDPLPCGAHVWIETHAVVQIDDITLI